MYTILRRKIEREKNESKSRRHIENVQKKRKKENKIKKNEDGKKLVQLATSVLVTSALSLCAFFCFLYAFRAQYAMFVTLFEFFALLPVRSRYTGFSFSSFLSHFPNE